MGVLKNIRSELDCEAVNLLDEYRERLSFEAHRLCGDDRHAADDLVMRTFETYFLKRESYDPAKGPLLPWLKTIMRNLHADAKRNKAQSSMVYLSPEEIEFISDMRREAVRPEEGADWSENELVRKAIDELPEKVRTCVLLRYYDSLSTVQIAKVLAISPDSVRSRLCYANKILVRRLGRKIKKPLIAMLAIAFSVATLFGAWKAADALGWLPESEEPQVVETPSSTATADENTVRAAPPQPHADDSPQSSEQDPNSSANATRAPAATAQPISNENKEAEGMNLKTAKTMVAAAATALATTAQAVTYIWTGATGDGKWSTPGNWTVDGTTESTTTPGKSDSVVFTGALGTKGHSTVDANFQGEYVANLTIAKDFTGSVTLGRDFWVFRVYDQSAGTFNGGSYRFTVGTPSRSNVEPKGSSSFYHRGGTFNAPDAAGEFRFDFSYEATDFVSTGGVFNANGGTVTILSSFTSSATAHNWQVYGRTFYNLNFADGTFAPIYRGKGTNTIENAFTFRNGLFNQANDKYVVFNVMKDCYIGGHTAGGAAVINICGDGEQHVYGDAADCKSISLDVRKTFGKVYFHGEKLRFGRGGNVFEGVRFYSGDIDLSDVDQMAIESYNTTPPLRVDAAAHVVWPTTLKISNDSNQTFFGCVGQEFNNLELTHVSQCNIPYATTNTVNGTLTLNGCSLENAKLNWSWLPLPNNDSIQAAFILKGDLLWRRNGTPSTGGGVKMIFAGDRHQYIYTDAEDVHVSSIIVRKDPGSVLTAVGTNGVLNVGCARHASVASGDVFVVESGTFEFPTNCLAMHSCGNAHYRQLGGMMVPGKAEFRIESCSNSQLHDFIDPFYDLAIKHGAGTYISLGGSVNVTNNLKILGGHVRGDGTFSVYGDWIQEGVLESAYWTANVKLVGGNDQVFRTTDSTQNTRGSISMEKTGGTFALESDLWHRYDNNNTFKLTSGTIKLNGHRFLLRNMTVSDGAGLAFRPPEGETEPMIQTAGTLTLPASGAVQLDVLGKINPSLVRHMPLFGYASVNNYSQDRWNVRSLAMRAKMPRKSVPLVENVTADKILYFNWCYAYGFCITVR